MFYESTEAVESSPVTLSLVVGRDMLSVHHLIANADCSLGRVYLSRCQQTNASQLVKHFLYQYHLGNMVNYSGINIEDVVLKAVPLLADYMGGATHIGFGCRVRSRNLLLASR